MSVAPVVDRAYGLYVAACRPFRGPPWDRRLAAPFGTPEDMPPHEWRVSQDVFQALYAAAPPPYPIPNPKADIHGVRCLFGWLVIEDETLPPDTMSLDLASPMASSARFMHD